MDGRTDNSTEIDADGGKLEVGCRMRWPGVNTLSCTHMGEVAAWVEAIPMSGRVLEIGAKFGGSTKHMADMRPGTVFLSVDCYPPRYKCSPAQWWAERRSNTNLFLGTAQELFALTSGVRFDVIIVDGDHSEGAAYADLCVAWSLIRDQGMIIVHDYGIYRDGVPGGPTAATDRWCAKYGQKVEFRVRSSAFIRVEKGDPA